MVFKEKMSIQEELAVQAIGSESLEYLKQAWTPQRLAQEAEKRAVNILGDILHALNDDTLEDPDCFHRIEVILNALEENGIYTTRHDF